MREIKWTKTAPGVWKTTIGAPEGLTPLTCLNRKPIIAAMEELPEPEQPFSGENIWLRTLAAGGWLLSVPLEANEKLYGLGLQFMRLNQRGRTRYLRVNSDPKQDTGETHAPVPFVVSGRGYGLLVDCARAVTFYCGSALRSGGHAEAQARDRSTDPGWTATPAGDRLEVILPLEGSGVYLFSGPGLEEVVRRYNLFCGGGTLPPRWGLGFWHRVPALYNDAEVLEEALEFRRRGIPCDVIGLEPGWHSASYPATYEWDKGRYPDPDGFIRGLREEGFRLNLWEHPYVSPKSSLYTDLKTLSGSYSVWGGLAPDYTLEEARRHYMEQHTREHAARGVSGYKLDECDGSELTRNSWMFPAHAEFPSGHDGEQMRQLYGLLLQDMTDRIFRGLNHRTYGLVRASNAGAPPLPYVLYSDLYDHRQFVRALCGASFSGLLWCPEVRRAASAEDWVRRMQTVCFSPLAMLNAWGDNVKPWSYPEAEPVIRHYIRLRMRLLPYLYTAFAEYEARGIPPFRAMPLVLADDRRSGQHGQSSRPEDSAEVFDTAEGAYGRQNGREWDDQFCIGRDLLVAPLFAGEMGREVMLPAGVWYEAETGVRHEGNRIVYVDCPLERIPLFVREGAVIPLMPAADHMPDAGVEIPVELVHFGTQPGEGLLYDDDGETFEYERNGGTWKKLVVTQAADGSFSGQAAGTNGSSCVYRITGWQFGVTRLPQE